MTNRHLLYIFRLLVIPIFLAPFFSAHANAEPLKIGTDSWPPFREIKNNQVAGIDDDLWQELSQRMGFEIEYIRCPWKRCLDLMRAGEIDAMSGLAWRKERAEYIRYVEPSYYGCSTRFYIRSVDEKRLTSKDQLNELNIGMVRGSAYYPEFDQNDTLQKTELAQESVLLPLLASGRIDSYIGTDCQADFELANSRWNQQLVKAPFNPDNNTPLYIGFSRKSSWSKQHDEFSQTIKQVLQDNFQGKVLKKYYQGITQ